MYATTTKATKAKATSRKRVKPKPLDGAAVDRSFAKLARIMGEYQSRLESWARDGSGETFDMDTRVAVHGIIRNSKAELAKLAQISTESRNRGVVR
jgi:hypothetical protein